MHVHVVIFTYYIVSCVSDVYYMTIYEPMYMAAFDFDELLIHDLEEA